MAHEASFAAPAERTGPRILIVRLSALGDVIHGLPVPNALRVAFPDAFLAWVCEPLGASLLRGHEALDRLVEVPRGWLKRPGRVWQLARDLRGLRFDTALDLQGLTKSALAGWLSGAPQRIGFAGADGRELSPWCNNRLVAPTAAHVVDRNLQLLGPLGVQSPDARFCVPEDRQARARVAPFLCDRDLQGGFAVLNPGAGWPSKRWPRPRYAEVARVLAREHGLPAVVVWAGDQERAWAEEIVRLAEDSARLAPATTVPELAVLLHAASLCVGSDTGPVHLAAALEVPSVGLYGPMAAERNGLYGAHCISLQEMQVSGSSRQRRQASSEAMEAIAVEQVCAACAELLEREPPARPAADGAPER